MTASRRMPAESPDLPFGDINVVVLTDVHSWVGSHNRQEPQYDADYGDVLSFYQRLKSHCDRMGSDLWFVSNGDWAHGTGLAGPGNASSLLPLLEKMPWDAVNCGNHELYESAKVEYMMRPGGFVDWFGDRYLTANILRAKDPDKKPLGHQYKILRGKKSDLMVFGFLYNLGNPCDLIEIAEVGEVVKEQWFRDALSLEGFDAVLVLAHMDLVDPLVNVIRTAIRDVVGNNMPIQFITGHTHYRGETTLDELSTSFEAGRYLDTVGFVSFPTKASALAAETSNKTSLFKSVFLDANKQVLADTLNLQDYSTKDGEELSNFVSKTRQKMGLLEEIGCAPQDYLLNVPIDDLRSIWKLYRDEVVPKIFFSQEDTDDLSSVMFLSKESWRYDLLSANTLVVDDIWAVAPFNDTVTYMGMFSGETILQLNRSMKYFLIGDIPDTKRVFKLYTHDYGSNLVKDALNKIHPHREINPELTAYSSTMIWLSFVYQHWSCDGLMDQIPDWLPTPDHVIEHLGREDDDAAKQIVAVVLVFLAILLICCTIACCRIGLRYIGGGHHPILQNEMNMFHDDDGDDMYDGEDCDINETTPTYDHHEVL